MVIKEGSQSIAACHGSCQAAAMGVAVFLSMPDLDGNRAGVQIQPLHAAATSIFCAAPFPPHLLQPASTSVLVNMSIISRALASLFGGPDEHRLLFLGLDASGRTSCLYLMKLGELVTTIPTIGFNVETFNVGGVSLTAWDVGGCDKIRPLWRHYFQNTQCVVYFCDSNDRERLSETRDELHRLLNEAELDGAIVAVLATKQDLPSCMSVAEVRTGLALDALEAGRKQPIACIPTTCRNRETYIIAFNWIVQQLSAKKAAQPLVPGLKPAARASRSAEPGGDAMEELLQRWLEAEDEPDDDFLAALHDFTLDNWDHRTHLRVAWLLLTRHGRREGMARIFSGIKAFIDNSPRTKRGSGRGTTFHETMTYFWTHMVHYAIVATNNPRSDFKTFLLLNPQLANGGLFLHYYTKKLMLETAESRTQVALPDKRPLPSILGDVDSMKARASSISALAQREKDLRKQALLAKPQDDSDEAFLQSFEARNLPSWGHRALLRVVFAYLVKLGRRRAVDKVCDGLKALQKDGFNLTLAYFWLQMVTLALMPDYKDWLFPPASTVPVVPLANKDAGASEKGLEGAVGTLSLSSAPDGAERADSASSLSVVGGTAATPDPGAKLGAVTPATAAPSAASSVAPAAQTLPTPAKQEAEAAVVAQAPPQFEALLSGRGPVSKALCKLLSEPQLFLKHYSKDLIYSTQAAEQVVLPDKKPLPNTL